MSTCALETPSPLTLQRPLLVVEDEPTIVDLLTDVLADTYALSIARDGHQALQLLAQQTFDLALLDISLPGGSGIELCRAMKQDSRLVHIPVLFLTGNPGQMEAAFGAGGVDYLIKPFRAQELRLRLQTHLRLSDLEQALRKQLSLRDLTLLTLAHDLRNPIGTSAALMQRAARHQDLPKTIQDLVRGAAYAAKQGYELLEDTLTWAQALGESIKFQPTWLSLLELSTECISTLQPKATQKDLILGLEISEDIEIYADKFLVRTILLNLLNNALKFTAQGAIIVRGWRYGGQAILEVTDTGIGIPQSVVNQLEQHLPIVSQPGTEGEPGTGMGLKICQEFAAYHGGTLKLLRQSKPGSCIRICLPQPEQGSNSALSTVSLDQQRGALPKAGH